MPAESLLIESITRSPHSVDPLSWFIRPFLPVTFAIAMAIAGTGFIAGTQRELDSPGHQFVALGCFVLACLAIHRRAKPRLKPFLVRHAVVPLLLAWFGVAISGVSASPAGDISRWWTPLGVALVLAALAPFNSAVRLTCFGLLSTVVCSVVAMVAFDFPAEGGWPQLTTMFIAAVVPLQATVATAVFSGFVVDRMLRWSALPIQSSLADGRSLDFSQWNSQSDDLKLLSDRVLPFLDRVTNEGFISMRDRTIAAELATEVRDALLKTVDRSWLDSLASDHGLRVIDPDGRAIRLTLDQRGAVRSLIVAALGSAALVPDTLSIELRDSTNGDVAVALTMRIDLPEGKRMMLFAPYYLALGATVDDLDWDDQEQLSMKFRIPAPDRQTD